MIKLFITDLDGCISMPFISPDWNLVSKVKSYSNQSKTDSTVPALTMCSGRPLPYVEAVAQWLDVYHPMLFESGGGIYDMQKNRLHWHPTFDDERERELGELKIWLRKNFIEKYPHTIPEFAKRTDSGIINQEPKVIYETYPQIVEFVEKNYPNFEVHYTPVSINVISKSTNKGEGIKFLCELLELELREVAFIGDTSGDIPALKVVGHPFAPNNAKDYVKEHATAMKGNTTDAVIEAYEHIIALNRREKG